VTTSANLNRWQVLHFKFESAPKYRNPETGETWTGRGKPPLWIRDKDREQFKISDAV